MLAFMKKKFFKLFGFILILLISMTTQAQLSAPGSSASEETNYPVFTEIDSIFIFCASSELDEIGNLRMTTNLSGTITFEWEKYNNTIGEFEFFFSESTDAGFSEISGLADGGYRVTITQAATTIVNRAWVFNNWTLAEASITESNCDYFQLTGEFTTAELNYYDPADNTVLEVFKNVKVQWKADDNNVAAVLSPAIYNPPTKDTEYTLRVYDKFGCEGTKIVSYESIVTKAKFKAEFGEQDPTELEAPLTVSFINQSENGTSGQYEWFLFRDLDEIKRESENSQAQIDSINIVAYDDNPIYTYENTGIYNVKLVSKKVSENHICVDTFYIPDFIVVDSSYITVPNVFTPNGDGVNDEFVVKFFSMQSVQITLLNRWGRKIHYWESNNVRGFEGTWTETVWDGKLMGGRYASPGVYYYNVVGEGRDGTRRRAHGFFHLFREK